MSGGMIQTQRRDGTWKDAFPVDGYKTERAVNNVARKTRRPARLVNRKNEVIFTTEETDVKPHVRLA